MHENKPLIRMARKDIMKDALFLAVFKYLNFIVDCHFLTQTNQAKIISLDHKY